MSTPQYRYEVFETLGTGATSRVDKAPHTLIGLTVALKTLLRGFGSRDLQQQFLREAQIIGGLSHPNIVALYDVGTNKDGAPYFVMEYVEGKTLGAILAAGPPPLPSPPPPRRGVGRRSSPRTRPTPSPRHHSWRRETRQYSRYPRRAIKA